MSRRFPGISFTNKITLAGLLTVHLPLLAVVVVAVLDPGLGVPAIAAIAITVAALTAVAMAAVLGRLLAPMQKAGTHIADYLAHRQLPPLTPARDDEAGRFSSSANGSC